MRIGIGIDTARYGHVASFVREDNSPAAPRLEFRENHEGYRQLERRLEELHQRHPEAQLCVLVDVAGQYATNLLTFLSRLSVPLTVSVGQPQRNRNYHRFASPKAKSDQSESWSAGRCAAKETLPETSPLPPGFAALQEIASRLHASIRELTRHVNQLHNLLSRTFPELEFLVPNVGASYCLKLLAKYPTAARIASARKASLQKIPYLKADLVEELQAAARVSVASFRGEAAEALVRQLVETVQQSQRRKQELESLLLKQYQQLPETGQQLLTTIPGIGDVTAAVLTAKIGSIDRFETPAKLVSYFGAFPEIEASGFQKDGTPRPPRMTMSQRGNDLVRSYLWNAARAAIRFNPDVQALYARQRARAKRGDTALGHCMRKLLHQVFHVWKTQQPCQFHTLQGEDPAAAEPVASDMAGPTKKAAGLKVVSTDRQEVTAASSIVAAPAADTSRRGPARQQRKGARNRSIDYAYLRSQTDFGAILSHLNLLGTLRGSPPQLRGACPIHGSKSPRSTVFSANLDKKAFQCFRCGAAGNELDFWAAYHGMKLRAAAEFLADTFNLELNRTEKRNPYPESGSTNAR